METNTFVFDTSLILPSLPSRDLPISCLFVHTCNLSVNRAVLSTIQNISI